MCLMAEMELLSFVFSLTDFSHPWLIFLCYSFPFLWDENSVSWKYTTFFLFFNLTKTYNLRRECRLELLNNVRIVEALWILKDLT